MKGGNSKLRIAENSMWSIFIIFFVVIALAFPLVNCGGGGSDAPSSGGSGGSGGTGSLSGISVSGRAMKGVVQNASVNVYVLNADGSLGGNLGSTTTDGAGEYSLTDIVESATSCYVFEISGGAYTDEITGDLITMQPSDLLSAVVCDLAEGTTVMAITPLTTMAASRANALASEGAPLKTAVSSSNIGIAQQYGLDDILGTLPADPTDSTDVQTANRGQRYYGIVIAAMAQLAGSEGVRAIDFVTALTEDTEDGSLDGLNGSAAISFPLLNNATAVLGASAGTTDMQTSIDNFLASPNNTTYIADFDIATGPVEVGLNTAGRVYVETTQLPTFKSGQYSSIQLAAAGGTPGYTWQLVSGSLPSGLVLGSDGLIQGNAPSLPGGTSMSISAPFTVSVTDSSIPSTTSTIELRITTVEAGPSILTPACDPATQNQSYSCQAASATGGSQPYYYVLDSGNFPPMGLVLGTDGQVTGTPTVAGAHAFRVCAVDLVGAQNCGNVTITVIPADGTFDLTVTKTGSGSGTVSSSPAGIDCGTDCSEAYDYGSVLFLTATPDQGSIFVGWSGPCSGTGDCPVVMNSDWTVTAEFKASTNCSGGYSLTTTGDGGCTYYNGGSLSMSLNVSGSTFSGSAYADGIELRYIPSCEYGWDTSSSGSVSGTVDATGNTYSGTVNFPVSETGRTLSANWTGTLSGNTLSGTFSGGGDTGTFSLTCQ